MTNFNRFLTLFFAAVIAVSVCGADITWTWTASSGALGTVKSYDASLTGSTSPSTPAENTKAWHVERSSVVYTGFSSSCIQFGSGSGAETVTLTSSAFSGTIKSVYVECSSYNNAHQVAISVGGTTYLSATNTAKWTTVSSKGGTGTSSGEIQIAFTPGSRALYIKSITVTYNKDSGTPTHTLSSAVSPTGTGTVTLGSATVAEGSTTTATAAANSGYVFDHWAISGTGASLSSTTTNPTTVTMGTANATVTAYFVAKTAASVTLSVAGSTSTVSGKYVGDSYTLPSTAAECAGKTFVGWSKVEISTPSATKPTSNYYEKGESVTLAASQTFYAVYATSSSGGGGGSVEVTYNSTNFPTSYGTANTFSEYELEGYNFMIQQIYKNGEKMQWRAAGNSSGTGTIYNNETFPGHISSIVLEYDASDGNRNHTLEIGSSANPSGGTSIIPTNDGGTTYTFDCSGYSYDYFVLTNGSGAGYTASITINYGGAATYSNYTTSCVACSTPTLTFASSTITKYVGDANFTNTLTVSNNDVSGAAITYTSNNTSKAEVNSSTGEVTIKQSTIDGTPVIITASRAAADGGGKCDVAVQQTYTLIIKNRINWIANEVTTTADDPTVATNYNGTITAIPTNPSVPSACSSKSFVGWTTVADWDSDDAPDPLYPDLASFSSLKIQENKTFYAVFASTTTGDPESTLTQTMQYDTWTYSGSTTNKSAQKYRLFGDDAYIQSEGNVNWANLSQVIVYGGYFGDSECTGISIRKADGSTTWLNGDVSGNNQTKANTFSGGASLTGSSKMRVYVDAALCDGSTSGVRISKVEIYEMVATTVGTAYATKCCTDWDDPTLTYDKYSIDVEEADATKSLSGTTHGTLSFSSSNTSIATVNPSTGAVHAVSPGNVTITANWTKDGSWCAKAMPINFTITGDVTITFDANGGTGSMASQVVSYATTTSLNSMSGLTAPDGKTFIGWNTQANGKGTAYANGASVKLTTNTTLYAQWGTSYTLTLHRGASSENIVVLSSEFPYKLPASESDYCDDWQFDGWSATNVSSKADSYTRVTEAVTAENAHFYAVYKGDSYTADAYVRISSADQLTSGGKYIFVSNASGQKHVMTNSYSTTYNSNGEISTTQIDETGKDYFLTSLIPATSVYTISQSGSYWYIKNDNNNKYVNVTQSPWFTTTSTTNTVTIKPNGVYWEIKSTKSMGYPYFMTRGDFTSPNRVVFVTYNKHSGCLQIYKKETTTAYKYISTPTGTGCGTTCEDCGAQFTYPSMEKTISSANFTNAVIYSGTPNAATPTYTSSNAAVATIVNPATGEVHIEGIGSATITMTQKRSSGVCGTTISYELNVTSPTLEVVEVTADDKLIIEHDFGGVTTAKSGVEQSTTVIHGTIADDIFISKYYEAAGYMKLIGIYNGTEHNIDLSKLRIRSGSTSWTGTQNFGIITFATHPKLLEDYPDMQLPPFTELIFWSNQEDDNMGYADQLIYCLDMEIEGKKYTYDDMTDGKVPHWYRVETINELGQKALNFGGGASIIFERTEDGGSSWNAIDLLGAGSLAAPVLPTGSGNGQVGQHTGINDNVGFYWDATSAAGKVLSTNRFYLTRLSTVKSGLNAVEKNTSTFVTLGEEWNGGGVGANDDKMTDYCESGGLFSEVAQYDYAGYYTDYEVVSEGWTASDNGDGTLTIQFATGKLAELACKKLRITVTDATDNTKSAEVEYNVPIIVKDGKVTTHELFNVHDKDECKVCDVAILNGGVLTKSKPTTSSEVAADREQVYNVDVYGGGELYIPSGTTYTVNTLTVRSKGDAVGIVDVQGKLIRNNTTLIHNKRFHNEGADWRWYYFSLPYDCDVSTVTYSNGDPAVHGVDFEIDWYDGESRASSQANGNWRSIASHPDYPNMIKAGYGYTIAVEEKSGHKNVSLLFPMANFTEATQINVPVGNWGAGDDGVTVNHKGWNVVGNPFLTRYKAQEDLDVNGELRTGMLVYEGGGWTQTDNGVNYATVPINGGQSGYTQEALTNRNFDPFMSFIIQVGGDAERNDLAVQLKNTYKNKRSSIVQRKESEYEVDEKTPVWLRLNLSNANGETDQTTVLISDNYSTEYDMQRDLAKWRGTSYKYYTRPVLASVYGGHELAFDALPDSIVADRVPLTYYSRNAGTMAFELSNSYNWQALDEVILYDAQSNTQHNLLTKGKYEFQSAAGEVGNRFSISAKVNRRNEPAITTGIILPEMQNVRLAVINRNIMLNGLTEGTQVYVFDMSGRLVGRQTAKTPYISFTVPAIGVYNIRLVGKNAGTTLRALVQH